MKGDVLIINEHHKQAAGEALDIIYTKIEEKDGKFIITVAGESGAGKSEIAASLAEHLEEKNIKTFIFQQDDYFHYPPKTNARRREQDISRVGTQEVNLDRLDNELQLLLEGENIIDKPLVYFEKDLIDRETVDLSGYKVIIAEGTYTTTLKSADIRIFIDRNIHDTRESRQQRAREKQDAYLEKILEIEHNIISKHKALADIIITRDYHAIKA